MKVEGKYLMVRVDGHTVALATSCQFEASLNTLDGRTLDDEAADDIADYISWSVNCDNLLGKNPGTEQHTHSTLMRLFLEKKRVTIEVMLAAGALQGLTDSDWQPGPYASKGFAPVGGTALIKSLSAKGDSGSKAALSIQLAGQGALRLLNYPTTTYVDGTTLVVDGPAEVARGRLRTDIGGVIDNILDI